MILSDFQNSFEQLAHAYGSEQGKEVSQEIERINSILQNPCGSVHEAFSALQQIEEKLSRHPSCQSLAQSVHQLVNEEKRKFEHLTAIGQEQLSPLSPSVSKEKVTAVYPPSVLTCCTKAFSDLNTICKQVSDEWLETFYTKAEEEAIRLLEKLYANKGKEAPEHEKTLIKEKMLADKQIDKHLIKIFTDETRKSPLFAQLGLESTLSVDQSWIELRELIKEHIALVRFFEGKKPLELPETSSLDSPSRIMYNSKFFETYGPKLRELYSLIQSMPEAPTTDIWTLIARIPLMAMCSTIEDQRDPADGPQLTREYFESALPRCSPDLIKAVYEFALFSKKIAQNNFENYISIFPEPLAKFIIGCIEKDIEKRTNDSTLGQMKFMLFNMERLLLIYNNLKSISGFEIATITSPIYMTYFLDHLKQASDQMIISFFEETSATSKDLQRLGFDNTTKLSLFEQCFTKENNLAHFSNPFSSLSSEDVQKYTNSLVAAELLIDGYRPAVINKYIGKDTSLQLLLDGWPPEFIDRFENSEFLSSLAGIRLPESLQPVFRTITKQELDSLLEKISANSLDVLFKEKKVANALSSKEKMAFFLRVADRSFIDFSIDNQRKTLNAAHAIFEALHNPKALFPQDFSEKDIYRVASKLTKEESLALLEKLPKGTLQTQYLAEALGVFEVAIETLPLSSVATEPLIRFLASMPFEEAKNWLDKFVSVPFSYSPPLIAQVFFKVFPKLKSWVTPPLPSHLPQSRLETLSKEQKNRILRAFPRYESKLPLAPWMDLFGIKEEEAKQIVEAEQESPDQTQNSRYKNIDANDPLSAFVLSIEGERVGSLLQYTKESSICGGRSFLTWGNASADKSLCVAQNSSPLHTRVEGKSVSLYPRGIFNDMFFPTFAVSLRRRFCQLSPQQSAALHGAVLATNADRTPEKELYYEIKRMENHLRETYPTLSFDEPDSVCSHFHSVMPHKEVLKAPPSSSGTEAPFSTLAMKNMEHQFITGYWFKKDQCFRSLLGHLVKETIASPSSKQVINLENTAHKHGLIFMSLFFLARHAKIDSEKGLVEAALSPRVHFRLKYVDPEPVVRLEDNPGFTKEQFTDFKTDYPFHTLSPLTLNSLLTPQKFQQFAENVQSLSEEEFYALCAACMSKDLLSTTEDDAMFMETSSFIDLVTKSTPKEVAEKVLTNDTSLLFIEMIKNYIGVIPSPPVPLAPGNKISFNRDGLDDYSSLNEIPKHIHTEGNFASAICKFATPYDTRLHDGNCGINSFLIGFLGHDVLDKDKMDLTTLYGHVREFRKKIVDYASLHKTELQEKFGEEEVSSLIDRYGSLDAPEWTGSIVWECAANIYKRPIVAYDSPSSPGDTFSIGEKGEVAPSAIFQPKESPQGPPIHLMHFGPHYCYLERK